MGVRLTFKKMDHGQDVTFPNAVITYEHRGDQGPQAFLSLWDVLISAYFDGEAPEEVEVIIKKLGPRPTFYTFQQWYIPERMGGGIERYVRHGVKPGDFLIAIIENDLVEAAGRADDENLVNLPAYTAYLYNEMPSQAWGSKEKMVAWMEHKGLEGLGG